MTIFNKLKAALREWGGTLFFVILKGMVWVVLVEIVVITSVFSWQIGKHNRTAETTMTLNYQEAAEGLYPNKTRFNINDLRSTEVMQMVIDNANLQDVTTEELADSITAVGTHSKNLETNSLTGSEDAFYITTSYKITYKKIDKIQDISTESMLALIISSYQEYFYTHYADNQQAINYDDDLFRDGEYLEVSEGIEMEAQQIGRYLTARASQNGTFRSEETGETFTSLKAQVDNFTSIVIPKFEAYIIQTGLSKDEASFISKMQYKNKLYDVERQISLSEYNVCTEAVNLYDNSLTSVVLVPTLDTNGDYYMARTKVAIDYISEQASRASQSANGTLQKINYNNDLIAKIQAVVNTDKTQAKWTADSMLSSMTSTLSDLAQRVIRTDKEFMRYNTRNYLSFVESELSFQELWGVKWMILFGGVAFVATCIIIIMINFKKQGGSS